MSDFYNHTNEYLYTTKGKSTQKWRLADLKSAVMFKYNMWSVGTYPLAEKVTFWDKKKKKTGCKLEAILQVQLLLHP